MFNNLNESNRFFQHINIDTTAESQLISNISGFNNIALDLINSLKDFAALLACLKSNEKNIALDSAITNINNDANTTFDNINTKFNKITEYEERAKNSIENIEGWSVEIAGHKQSEFFEKSHVIYQSENIIWFFIIFSLLIGLGFGILHFNEIYSFNIPVEIKQENFDSNLYFKFEFYLFVASKISFVFTMLLAIYFAIRNYNANKHNSILNKHRADSLRTYKAIIDVAGKDKQDIILTQISDCMFKHQDTGFGKLDDSGLSSEQMINLFTKLIGKPKDPV
jgi:hypothetical protein